jgi:DNA polymerase III delta' subunit
LAEKSISWKYLVAQDRVREILGELFSSGTLGHAYMFCGEEGVGKFAAALDMAMALLCTGGASVPCHECASCKKVLHNNHPDLHIVLPLPFRDEHRTIDGNGKEILSQKGWEFISASVFRKIKVPYLPLSFGKEDGEEKDDSGKKISFKIPTIPVDWIRKLNHEIVRGPIAGERSVVIFHDIDIMKDSSANAFLKTLEEPPANTFMFLTTSMPASVLPTIASRCQTVRFGHVPPQQIKDELVKAFGSAVNDQEIADAVFYSMGSLGRALIQMQTEQSAEGIKTLQETAEDVKQFWNLCCSGDWLAVTHALDSLVKERNFAVHEQFLSYMLYLIRNTFLHKTGRSENYFDPGNVLADPSGIFSDPSRTSVITKACDEALSSVRRYGNVGIIFVNLIMTVMETLNVEKQQAG